MISFSNINKQYGKQLIFVDACFQLNPGEKVGLVGPNGSGKTTLLRMVVGEDYPDEGEVSVPKRLTIVSSDERRGRFFFLVGAEADRYLRMLWGTPAGGR
jgi:ATPase subunit of ABC transporter with duplicated ATPase domains